MGTLHRHLFYHTEVSWQSTYQSYELLVYLQQGKSDYCLLISNPEFPLKLAFLCDIFEHLNILNKSLQGGDENDIAAKDKLHGFTKKLVKKKNRLPES